MTVNGWTVTRTHLSGNWYHIKAQRTFTSKTTAVAYGTATYSGAVLSVSFAGYGAAVTVIVAGNIMLSD